MLLIHTPEGENAMLESTARGRSRSPRATRSPSSPRRGRARARRARCPRSARRPPRRSTSTPTTGELAAPLGTIDHLAEITLALAKAFGGLTVATAEFATHDPDLPITFAAREGERVVLQAGDDQFEL